MSNNKLPEALPEDNSAKEHLMTEIRKRIIESLRPQEGRFSDFPELQKKLSEEAKHILVESITEAFLLLGLSEDMIPDFYIFDEKTIKELGLIPNSMWISTDDKKEVAWFMNFDWLYNNSRQIANETSSSKSNMAKAELRRRAAHEAHHIFDIYFNPERAKRSGEANAQSDMAFLDPGEYAANEFGYRYRDLKAEEDDKR